jgi:hypothetical protein
MSHENVEALRLVYERWSGGDFWTPEIFDPDVEVVWDGLVDVGTYRGLDGFEQSVRKFFSAWDEMRMAVEVAAKFAHVWTMRAGKQHASWATETGRHRSPTSASRRRPAHRDSRFRCCIDRNATATRATVPAA